MTPEATDDLEMGSPLDDLRRFGTAKLAIARAGYSVRPPAASESLLSWLGITSLLERAVQEYGERRCPVCDGRVGGREADAWCERIVSLMPHRLVAVTARGPRGSFPSEGLWVSGEEITSVDPEGLLEHAEYVLDRLKVDGPPTRLLEALASAAEYPLSRIAAVVLSNDDSTRVESRLWMSERGCCETCGFVPFSVSEEFLKRRICVQSPSESPLMQMTSSEPEAELPLASLDRTLIRGIPLATILNGSVRTMVSLLADCFPSCRAAEFRGYLETLRVGEMPILSPVELLSCAERARLELCFMSCTPAHQVVTHVLCDGLTATDYLSVHSEIAERIKGGVAMCPDGPWGDLPRERGRVPTVASPEEFFGSTEVICALEGGDSYASRAALFEEWYHRLHAGLQGEHSTMQRVVPLRYTGMQRRQEVRVSVFLGIESELAKFFSTLPAAIEAGLLESDLRQFPSRAPRSLTFKGLAWHELHLWTLGQVIEGFGNLPRLRGIASLLDALSLDYLPFTIPLSHLDGGSLRRVCLARDMGRVRRGYVYLTDDPLAGVSPRVGLSILSNIRSLVKAQGAKILSTLGFPYV